MTENKYAEKSVPKWARKAGIIAFIVVTLAGLAGTWLVAVGSFEHLKRKGNLVAAMVASNISTETIDLYGIVEVMSGSPWIYPALITGSAQDLEKANSVLDRYNASSGASVSYLIDAEGTAIASSNRDSPESFVGRSYSGRPYFKASIAGEHFHYFALGVASGLRGYFASHPVRHPATGEVIGVAVMKEHLEHVEKRMAAHKKCFFISPEGVIFLAGDPALRFKSVWSIPYEIQNKLLASRQFGDEPFEAMISKRPENGGVVDFRGRYYAASYGKVGDEGWAVFAMEPMNDVFAAAAMAILATLFFLGLVAAYLLYLRAYARSFEMVRESEEKFRMLSDATNEGVVIHYNGVILEANRRFADILGYEPDEIIGADVFEYIHPEDRQTSRDKVRVSYDEPYEVRGVRKDGTSVIIEICGKALYYNGQDARVASVRDVTAYKEMQDVLERVAQEWVTTFNSIPDMVSIHDRNYRIIRANKAFADFLGMRMEDVIGKTCYEVVHKTKVPAKACPFMSVLENREKTTSEMYEPGLGVYLEVTVAPLYSEAGEVTGVVHIAKDITARKKIEEALRSSENKFKTLFESSRDAIMLLTPDKGFFSGNPATIRLFGCADEAEFTRQHPATLSPEYQPDGKLSAAKAREMMAIAMEKGSHFFEWTHKKMNGEEFFATVLLAKMELEGKAVLQATVRDISENKKAELAVAAANVRFRQIFQSAADGMLVINMDRTISKANRAMLGMLGLVEADVVGKICSDVLDNEICSGGQCVMERVLRGEKQIESDMNIRSKSGAVIPCILTAGPYYGPGGTIVGVIESFKDITERKSAENVLIENIRLKTNFTSMVSHELRTPLTAIKEGISIVLDGSAGPVNNEQKDFLDTAFRNVERLTRLINDVLDFSKLKSGKMAMRLKEEDISLIAGEVVKANEPLLSSRGLYLKTDIAGEMPRVRLDRDRIIQVLTNLMSNASKFTEKGGITLTARREGDEVIMSVEDTGQGIKKDDISKLFSEFRQLEDAKTRKAGGTGLGLAICKQIIERHGGRIWAESEEGKGSAFRFSLPVERKFKVLVIDDDAAFQDFTGKLLSDRGFVVHKAFTGAEGVETAKGLKPDLIVLDMRLPDMNGYEVVGRLQSDEDVSGIPVLAVSGYEDELRKLDKFKAGTFPRMIKPFNNEEFLKNIKTLLSTE